MKKIKKAFVGRSRRFRILTALVAVASITAFVWGATRFQEHREQSSAQANACASINCDANVFITVTGLNNTSDARFFSTPYTFGTCNDPNQSNPTPYNPTYHFTSPYPIYGDQIWCRGFQFGPPNGVKLYANTNSMSGYNVNFLFSSKTMVSDGNGNSYIPASQAVNCPNGSYCWFKFEEGEAYVIAQYSLKSPSAPSLSFVSASQTSINLDWTASTPPNQSTVKYNVYKNNSQIASSLTSTSFSNGGLSCGQNFTYYVKAVATGTYGGSSSAQSNSVQASTDACPASGGGSGGSSGGGSTGGSGGGTTTPPSSGGGSSGGSSSGGGSGGSSSSGGSGGNHSSSGGGNSVPSSVGSRHTTPPSSSGSHSTSSSATPDTTPPSIPSEFTATSALGDVGVNLNWRASSDNEAVAGYKLERSDAKGKTWSIIGATITGTSSVDADTKFNTHYQYRVSAFDEAGNYSGYAKAIVDTAGFQANAGPTQEVTLTSADNVVTATIPAGALSENAVCSIEIDANLGESPDVAGYDLAAGPYQVVCKNKDGISVSTFNQPVRVSIDYSGFKQYDALVYYSRQLDSGQWDNIVNITHDDGNHTDSFDLTDSTTFAVMGKQHKASFWLKLIWILIIVALVAAGIYFFLRWRKKHVADQMYDDYYRKSQGL